jgi:DNA-nicking Smr family endonuclease
LKKKDAPRSEKRPSAKLPTMRQSPEVAQKAAASGAPDDYTRGARPLPTRAPRVAPPSQRASAPPPAIAASREIAPTFQMGREGEVTQGARVGFGQRLRELARGLLPVFDTLDLHGATAEKAEAAVRSFCTNARGPVARTVLIVHGKGIHSPLGHPVLRDEVAHWLSTPPAARDVLCFATAQPRHGGTGATYVLLAARPHGPGTASNPPRKPRTS